jgi:hypothetical protein
MAGNYRIAVGNREHHWGTPPTFGRRRIQTRKLGRFEVQPSIMTNKIQENSGLSRLSIGVTFIPGRLPK